MSVDWVMRPDSSSSLGMYTMVPAGQDHNLIEISQSSVSLWSHLNVSTGAQGSTGAHQHPQPDMLSPAFMAMPGNNCLLP
jgi:hypothetical protein